MAAPGDSDSSGGAVDEEFAGCLASWKIHAGETDLNTSFFLREGIWAGILAHTISCSKCTWCHIAKMDLAQQTLQDFLRFLLTQNLCCFHSIPVCQEIGRISLQDCLGIEPVPAALDPIREVEEAEDDGPTFAGVTWHIDDL